MRTPLAALLVLEAVVVALAIPVALTTTDADPTLAGWGGALLVLACLLLAGMLKRPWAIAAGWVLQALVVLSGFVVPLMFVLGAVFAVLWGAAVHFGRQAERIRAERLAAGR